MNNEEIEKLKEKITEFENQNILIKIEEAIQYHFTIYQAKIITSNEKLVISDQKEQDFIVELYYLDSINIEGNTIHLCLSNDINIEIDY